MLCAPYQTVLLCYDGSAAGRKALQQGAHLAAGMNARIHLLAVVDVAALVSQDLDLDPGIGLASDGYEQAMREVLNEGLQHLLSMGLHAEEHLEVGRPVDTIVAVAARLNVDLVVVGHRCKPGINGWWSKPNGAALLDLLDCSLLVTCSSPDEQPAVENVQKVRTAVHNLTAVGMASG